jgi:hypothetical protein
VSRGSDEAGSGSVTTRFPPGNADIPVKPKLPEHVAKVVFDLQSRVWRLRNLIQCVRETDATQIEDRDAALSGLVEYADSIYREMDAGLIAERAVALREGTP